MASKSRNVAEIAENALGKFQRENSFCVEDIDTPLWVSGFGFICRPSTQPKQDLNHNEHTGTHSASGVCDGTDPPMSCSMGKNTPCAA